MNIEELLFPTPVSFIWLICETSSCMRLSMDIEELLFPTPVSFIWVICETSSCMRIGLLSILFSKVALVVVVVVLFKLPNTDELFSFLRNNISAYALGIIIKRWKRVTTKNRPNIREFLQIKILTIFIIVY